MSSVLLVTSLIQRENVNKPIPTANSSMKITVTVSHVIKDLKFKELVVFQRNKKLEILIVMSTKMGDV